MIIMIISRRAVRTREPIVLFSGATMNGEPEREGEPMKVENLTPRASEP